MSVCIPKWNNNICACGGWHTCVCHGVCVELRRQPWPLILGLHMVKSRFSITLYAFQVSWSSSFRLDILTSHFNIGVLGFQNHNYFIYWTQICVCKCPQEPEEGIRPLRIVFQFWAAHCEYWEPNSGPLQEWQVSFTTESSFRPSKLHTCTEFSIGIFKSIFLTMGDVSFLSILNDGKPQTTKDY